MSILAFYANKMNYFEINPYTLYFHELLQLLINRSVSHEYNLKEKKKKEKKGKRKKKSGGILIDSGFKRETFSGHI